MPNNPTVNPKSLNLKPKSIAIKVQNLTKTYKLYKEPIDRLKEALNPFKKSYHNDFYALKDVAFEVNRGETVGIIGRNGSGKSTLLKIITGVLMPSGGQVKVNGKISAILELGAGFNPELSGLENIYLNMSINGITKQETNNKIDEILDFAEIGDFIYQPLKTYSSGMKARLAFALAINIEPDILIVDEALAVGDAAFQRKCFAKIERFKEEGKTILFVSHSIGQVIQLCNKAIWLHKGEKVLEGNTKLIAGLYQKYSANKVLDITKVRDELNTLKTSTNKTKIKKEIKIKKSQIYFNDKLKSKSTIIYEENGARISNVQLLSDEFQEVNIVRKDMFYYYSYFVKFDRNYREVRLAMLIKTKNGIEIGGKEVPLIKSNTLKSIEVNKKYHILWKFKNIFNAGTYFFNCGVNTIMNDKKVVLHRMIDAYMFEVVQEKNDYANNIVDLKFELHIESKL